MPRVRITDVSPRDGLQNEPTPIPTADKVRLIDSLSLTGVDEIEVSSFVSPRWVPQLGDAAEVFSAITPAPAITYSALVPNERGLESAIAVRAATLARLGRALPDKLAVFTAASQTFSRRNTNATIEETIHRFAPIAAYCKAQRIPLRGYISCVIACPFEGPIAREGVRRVAQMLLELGVDEIDLGDTIGAATPDTVEAMLRAVMPVAPPLLHLGSANWGDATREGLVTPAAPLHASPSHSAGARPTAASPNLTLHLHDTFGHAAACVERALALGVRSFDSSAGGLGGCPYASTPTRRAPGNISTASLLAAIERAAYQSTVDATRMAQACLLATSIVNKPTNTGGPPP